MTVKELIDELKLWPKNGKVSPTTDGLEVYTPEGEYDDFIEIEVQE
jgi:hypothetical protein